MKVLYVAPYPPMKNGVADYAFHFKRAIEQNLDIQMDLLDISLNEDISTPSKFRSLREQVRALHEIEQYDLAHFEIGAGQNREFYILHFLKTLFPRVKVVATLHDPPRVLLTPMRFMGLERMPRAVRAIRRGCDMTLGKHWVNRGLTRVDQIIVLSEEGKRRTRKKTKREIAQLPFLSYGAADGSAVYRGTVEKMLFFGYMGRNKGLDVLIRSFARLLLASSACRNLKLYVCGGLSESNGESGEYRSIKNLPVRLGIGENVIFTGWITQEEKDFHLRTSDVLILPYRKTNSYGASATLIEGMSYGLPVIVSDVKSFKSEVDDGNTGLLFEDGNVEMLAEKMNCLVESKELRERLGSNARDHVNSDHAPRSVASKVRKIYEACLSG